MTKNFNKDTITNDELLEVFKTLVENSSECIWILDVANKKFKYISPSIFSLRGLSVEEAMNETLEKALTPESLAKVLHAHKLRIKKYCEGDRSDSTMSGIDDLQQYTKDGRIINVEVSTKYVPNKETNLVDILGISRDITKRIQLENSLKNEIQEKETIISKLLESEQQLLKLQKELEEKNKELKEIATTDELTGVYNRYYFDKVIVDEILRTERYNESLSLILLDIDDFKKINDSYGHDVGDQVLKKISEVISRRIREPDVFARWGGEEFVILLPQTDLNGAFSVAEKVRKLLSEFEHEIVGKVTASFGVAERAQGEAFSHWFKKVDKFLYVAKNKGKNCVVGNKHSTQNTLTSVNLNWKSQWNSGNKIIDIQHRHLINLTNHLLQLALTTTEDYNIEKELDTLINHCLYHFHYEEGLQKIINFPELENHKNAHKKLIEKVLTLKSAFNLGTLKASSFFQFLVDDLIQGHIILEDVLFFPYIKAYKN